MLPPFAFRVALEVEGDNALPQWGRGDDTMPRVKPKGIEFDIQQSSDKQEAWVYCHTDRKILFSYKVSLDSGVEVKKPLPLSLPIKASFNIHRQLIDWLRGVKFAHVVWVGDTIERYAVDSGHIQQCFCCSLQRARVMELVPIKTGEEFRVCSRKCRKSFIKLARVMGWL